MSVSPLVCGHCGASNAPGESFCGSCGHALSASTTKTLTTSTLTGQLPSHTVLKQRYLILQAVGQGGMGAVYLAQDTTLGDRLVAVKEMSLGHGEQTQETIENFTREAHLLASLQHPNLPSIYDHFEEGGRWYLVMSFIQGETLEEYLAHVPDQKLSLEETLQIGQELCNVLNYLHTHHPPIIFRDLKPDNIMRTTDGHLYLIDFGIARHFKPGQVKDTANYGSAGYAPPEQYGKAQTTERSDIYSLGATLYQLLSGHDPSLTPFRFPPLQSLVPTLPDQLVQLVTQMLDMDENKRPASVQDVLQELRAVALPVPMGQYTSTLTIPQRPVLAAFARQQTTASQQALPTQTRAQSILTHLRPGASAAPVAAQQPAPGMGEALAIGAMLVGMISALVGVLALFVILRNHHNTLANITLGGLLLSLGVLAVVAVRSRITSSLVARIQKVEILAELLTGLFILIFAILAIIITYNGFMQDLGLLDAGIITAENMLSLITGTSICLLVYRRFKRAP